MSSLGGGKHLNFHAKKIIVIGRMVASVEQRKRQRVKPLSFACRAVLDAHLIKSIQIPIGRMLMLWVCKSILKEAFYF